MTKKKNERNAGAKPKFPNKETKKLRIEKIVLAVSYDETKRKCTELINKLQSASLTKCSEEALKSN